MTRTVTTLALTAVCAALLAGCDSSSGNQSAAGGKDPSAPKEVKAGSYERPGADLSAAAQSNDPTGGKPVKKDGETGNK